MLDTSIIGLSPLSMKTNELVIITITKKAIILL